MKFMVMIWVGVLMAVFGLAQGLMVQHPSSPLFVLAGGVGIVLVISGIIGKVDEKKTTK